MPLTQQKHYTIGYHDNQNHKAEICEYAIDAHQAIKFAREDLPDLIGPHSTEYCLLEE